MANYIERDIFVLRDTSCVAQPIEYVKGTNTVPVLLHVRDNDIPAGSTARVYVEWPSGKGEYDEGGVTISGNDILIQPKSTLFSETGKCSMQVCIKNGTKTLVTFSHPVMVKRNLVPGITDPAENHSDFLDEYLQKMEEATDSANEASKKANESADKADSALEAIEQASQGTLINDEIPSNVTTYSSNKIEEGLSLMDIQHSTNYDLYNTKQGGLRLIGMKGNTEQETLTGTNLFGGLAFANALVESGVQATIDTTSKTVALVAGNSTSLFEYVGDFRENTQYTIFFKGINSNSEYLSNTNLQIRYSDGTTDALRFNTTGAKTLKYTASGKTLSSIEGVWETSIATFYYEDFGIFEGVLTLDDFEPYCGNQPAPNPSYPIAIENSFDSVQMEQGTWSTSNGIAYADPTNVRSKRKIPCKSNDVIKFDFERNLATRIIFYNSGSFVSAVLSSTNGKTYSATVPSGADSFAFYVGINGNITPQTVGKITLTVNGKYVGQIVEWGKNHLKHNQNVGYIFNSRGITFTFLNDGGIAVEGTSTGSNVFVNLNYVSYSHVAFRNGDYITSGSKDNVNVQTIVNGIETHDKDGAFTIDDSTKNCWVRLQIKASNTTVDTVIYPMIRNADIGDDTYEPYTEHVATFYTDEPIRKGDVLFKDDDSRLWTVERNVKEKIFSGNPIEGWSKAGTADNGYQAYYAIISDMAKGEVRQTITSDKFIYVNNALWNDPKGYHITSGINENVMYISVKCTDASTATELLAYLAENQFTTQYPLATPTYEILDTASQLALNSLKTFKDATHIEVDSKIQPEGCEWEFGTSQVGALSLENANLHDSLNVSAVKGSVANNLTTTEEGFVLDARQGAELLEAVMGRVEKNDIVVVTDYKQIGGLSSGECYGITFGSDYSAADYVMLSAEVYVKSETTSNANAAKITIAHIRPGVNASTNLLSVSALVTNNTDSSVNGSGITIEARMVLVKR